MTNRSLLGEIVLRLSSHPENTATECLLYILRQHPAAWTALRAFLAGTGVELPPALSFQTQAWSEDEGIPDLVGTDSDGDHVFIVEAKFWAGLTENQPTAYLGRLPANKPGMLLFIAPGQRLRTLWNVLQQRCATAGLTLDTARDIATELRCISLPSKQILAVTSWRAVLGAFRQEASTRGDSGFVADVDQLGGLCARMDDEAFLPLTGNDLAPSIGRRVKQYADLVDAVVAEMVATHGASTKGLTTGGTQSTYGRYFAFGQIGFFFAYWPSLWARQGETPMWMRVSEPTEGRWTPSSRIRETINRDYANRPSYVTQEDGHTVVAIDLPLGVERDEVIAAVVEQIKRIVEICSSES